MFTPASCIWNLHTRTKDHAGLLMSNPGFLNPNQYENYPFSSPFATVHSHNQRLQNINVLARIFQLLVLGEFFRKIVGAEADNARASWSGGLELKSRTGQILQALQTVRHRFDIYTSSCVALVLWRGDGSANSSRIPA